MASNFISSSRTSASLWTQRQNNQFEEALATYDRDTPDRWHNIAMVVDGKSAEEVKRHFDLLVKDITKIESDQVPLPNYRTAGSNGRGFGNEQSLAITPNKQSHKHSSKSRRTSHFHFH